MLRLSFFLLLMTFSLNSVCSARDIFISPAGSDENPGTRNQPLATLEAARDLIRQWRGSGTLNEAVNVILTEGIHYLPEPLVLDERDSGTESAPITFRAEEGAKAVINGGIKITGWEKGNDMVWKAKVAEVSRFGLYFEQLYVNGQRATRAKSPNNGFYFLQGVRETVVSKGSGRTAEMAVQKLKVPAAASREMSRFSSADFEDALLVLYHKWDNTRKRVAGFSADSQLVYTAGGGMKSWNSLDAKTRFVMENYKAALDTAGEWYLDRKGELLYIPRTGEDPNKMRIYAPLTESFVIIRGTENRKVQHIRFENLHFEVSGYKTPLWGNEPAQAASPVEAVIMADYASHIDLVNCDVSQTGTSAVWLRKACSDCSIQHCHLHDLGAGGIKLGDIRIPQDENQLTKRITVDNNIVRSGGFVFPCAVGITLFQTSDNRVTHNEIADFRYSGVSVGWVWGYGESPSKRNIIEFNHIHHLGWGDLCDMGGVYCLGKSEGTSVSNNVIHHVYSFDYGGWGLYTDEGSTGIVMENNLVYACKNSGFHQHYGRENIIRNNIFAANLKGTLQATRVEEHLSFSFTNNIVWINSGSLLTSRYGQVKVHSDENAYWDSRTADIRFDKLSFREWQSTGKDLHSVVADPQFGNPEAYDFRINNKKLIKKIGFKPFDFAQAGVYGDPAWIELAQSSPDLLKRYDDRVKALMAAFP